jgi:transketolase N-terminal domain/subunit
VLAGELRERLIEEVTATGGHLGASLGALELIIALHVVFRSPHDALIFDTGHQAYAHKMLTGRAVAFGTLRSRDGLSGYPSRAESEHDWVENSHASGSLAYATGLATAMQLRGETDRRVVAVTGDGALTGGVALEGLNNFGSSAQPVIIVLNDNGRSYDPTTGAIAQHLARLRDGNCRDGNWFTALGFAYLGRSTATTSTPPALCCGKRPQQTGRSWSMRSPRRAAATAQRNPTKPTGCTPAVSSTPRRADRRPRAHRLGRRRSNRNSPCWRSAAPTSLPRPRRCGYQPAWARCHRHTPTA